MEYTKDSIRARHLWRAEHPEENHRSTQLELYLVLFGFFIMGIAYGILFGNPKLGPLAAIPLIAGALVAFEALWYARSWERMMGMPKLVTKRSQDSSLSWKEMQTGLK